MFCLDSCLFLFEGVSSPNIALALEKSDKSIKAEDTSSIPILDERPSADDIITNGTVIDKSIDSTSFHEQGTTSYTRKRHGKEDTLDGDIPTADVDNSPSITAEERRRSWRRILLLIVAITVHNIPGK